MSRSIIKFSDLVVAEEGWLKHRALHEEFQAKGLDDLAARHYRIAMRLFRERTEIRAKLAAQGEADDE